MSAKMELGPSEKRRKKTISSDRVFDVCNYAFLLVVIVLVAYPLYYVLVASISNPYQVYAGQTLLFPSEITFEGYKRVFRESSKKERRGTIPILTASLCGVIRQNISCWSTMALSGKIPVGTSTIL